MISYVGQIWLILSPVTLEAKQLAMMNINIVTVIEHQIF